MLNKIKDIIWKRLLSDINFFLKKKEEKVKDQEKILQDIIDSNQNCIFWKTYNFETIKNYNIFKKRIPVSHYEDYHDSIIQSIKWKKNLLTRENIIYFAKTAGTTSSGDKYIPVTKRHLEENHKRWWKELIAGYLHTHPDSKLLEGKSLILWWWLSKTIENQKIWYISALLHQEAWILGNLYREPKLNIYNIDNREEKLTQTIAHTLQKNITSLGWLTSRCLILLEQIKKISEKKYIYNTRPNLELYISGWINFEPYRAKFKKLLPNTNFCQSYNASEWFFGIQYNEKDTRLQLLTSHGVFFEFIKLSDYYKKIYTPYRLKDIEINQHYVLLITSHAWLYRYVIWDVISFSDIENFYFNITWRTKIYIDAFWEHIMIHDTDQAIKEATKRTNSIGIDYTVGPKFETTHWWCHEWIIAFDKPPRDKKEFVEILDHELQKHNSYYKSKRKNDVMMKKPIVHFCQKDIFYKRLEKKWKLGWQSKVPRLSNERNIIDEILSQ